MNCLDEGLLQALLDGELSAEAAREAEAHLASCHACAAAMGEAAQELALFSRAFAVDESLIVPTERLRSNIASAVVEMQAAQTASTVAGVASRESSGARVRSFWSSLAASFASRPVAVFAGLALAAVVLGALFYALRPGPQPAKNEPREIAKGPGGPTPVTGAAVKPAAPPTTEKPDSPDAPGSAATGEQIAKGPGPKIIRPEKGKFKPRVPDIDRVGGVEVAASGAKGLLPVEREYAREIAALSSSIERQKLQTLSPTLRAEYERNVAVVDEAIASTREAVKSNPKDRDAQEFLRSAYRDKLDLLSAVAGKSQLAAVGR